jgi:glutaredoxin
MAKKDKITIYTNETCGYCTSIKVSLDKEKIKYTEVITTEEENKAWQDIVSLTGMPTVPTIIFKNEIFVAGRDFQSPEQLLQIIKMFNPSKHLKEDLIEQRLRTLGYGVQTSMQRLDALLKNIEKGVSKMEANYRELFEDEETKTE